jgi:hypothetical protein
MADYLVRLLRVFAGYSSTLRVASESSLGYTLDWPRHDSSQFNFTNLAKQEISDFQTGVRNARRLEDTSDQVVVFPMIQSGVLGIREEERCLHTLFDLLDSGGLPGTPLVEITSGYFALYGPYQDRVVTSKADYRIVAASPSVSLVNLYTTWLALIWARQMDFLGPRDFPAEYRQDIPCLNGDFGTVSLLQIDNGMITEELSYESGIGLVGLTTPKVSSLIQPLHLLSCFL